MIAADAPALLPPIVLGESLVTVAEPEAVEMVVVEAGRAVDVAGSRAELEVVGAVVWADVGVVRRGISVAIASARTRAITDAAIIAVESAWRVLDEREEEYRALIKPQGQ
jgi:hypothetical protein